MQQVRTLLGRRVSGDQGPSKAQPRLVVAGVIVLLLGVGCVVLGSFAGLGEGPESVPFTDPRLAGPAADVQPVANNPLTSGEAVFSTSLPSDPTAQATPGATKAAKAAEPTQTVTATPSEQATALPSVTASVVPDCRSESSSGRNHNGSEARDLDNWDEWDGNGQACRGQRDDRRWGQ